MPAQIPAFVDTSFVPFDLDASDWSKTEGYFKALLDRAVNTPADLERWLRDRSELEASVNETRANLYINMTCHTDDPDIKARYMNFIENIEPKLKPLVFALDRKYSALPVRKSLDRKRFEVLDRNVEVDVALFREENIPLETQLDKLETSYQEICAQMTCTFEGKEQTLPQMGRYLEVTDRAVREASWRAVADRRLADADRISDIYDQMIGLRHKVAVNAGFPNFRDFMFKRLHRFDYTPQHCFAFHEACEKVVVPLLRKLNRQRGEALHLEPLRPWDLAVDVKGRAPMRPFETAQQLVDGCDRIFEKVDSSLGAMFKRLREPGCLDLDSRKGKAPGGYQYNRDRRREPFIFMNAAGLQRDVDTMLHEGGHAFHSMLSESDPLVWYRHAPMEFAEVASMSMELLAHPYREEFYQGADKARAVRNHLESVVTVLPWIATIDAFQHWVYTNPAHTRDERAAYWRSLTDRFGPAVSYAGLEKYRDVGWQRQLHLFGVPFYYIEYGIAQLGALQLYVNYKKDRSMAVESYKKGLALGGSRPLPELFAAAGLTFDFGPATVSSLIHEIEKDLATLPL